MEVKLRPNNKYFFKFYNKEIQEGLRIGYMYNLAFEKSTFQFFTSQSIYNIISRRLLRIDGICYIEMFIIRGVYTFFQRTRCK